MRVRERERERARESDHMVDEAHPQTISTKCGGRSLELRASHSLLECNPMISLLAFHGFHSSKCQNVKTVLLERMKQKCVSPLLASKRATHKRHDGPMTTRYI
jgi:hypothetical protein